MIPMVSFGRRGADRNKRAGPTSAAKDGFGPPMCRVHVLVVVSSPPAAGRGKGGWG